MSDRDRGRDHGGLHGGGRPPRGVPAYGYNQSDGIITYIDLAEPAGTASMVADGVNPSERHPTGNRHGQWERNAEFSYMQHARDALPLLQTPPSKHTNFGVGPPTGSHAMATSTTTCDVIGSRHLWLQARTFPRPNTSTHSTIQHRTLSTGIKDP